MTTRDHDAVVQALDRGEPFAGAAVERIDTLAAHVFLTGDRAYKLKRPVRFSFLDFTTLAARHDALAQELTLNRRTAPDLYLRVVKLVRRAGGLELADEDAPEPAVDWLLEMVRFPADAQLDHIAEQGPLPPDLAESLGRAIARFHATAEVTPDEGGATAMAEVVQGNRVDLERVPASVLAPAEVAAMDAAHRDALGRLGPLLDRRRDAGFVRHCHGDLHLGNLVRLGEEVVPFDCIEFSRAIACIDVAYDLAFLLMDLVHRDQTAAGQRVLETYLEATDDLDGLRVLPFFMAVRAVIRAKVEALAAEVGAPEPVAAVARAYLTLALELQPPPRPVLVGIGGLSGTGKTTLARLLAPTLAPRPGALVLRSDVVRKRLAGVSPTVPLPVEAYAPAASERVYQALRAQAGRLLDNGWSVVVDAAHLDPAARDALAEVAWTRDVPFVGLWLDAPAAALEARVAARFGDASDADVAVVRRQLNVDVGPLTWHRLEAGGSVEHLVDAARRRVSPT